MERKFSELNDAITARIETGDAFKVAIIAKLQKIKDDMVTEAKDGDVVIDAAKLAEYKQKILNATTLLEDSTKKFNGGRRNSRRHSRRKRRV
jgi:UDP-N-acetylmuramyl tripeptide synthase